MSFKDYGKGMRNFARGEWEKIGREQVIKAVMSALEIEPAGFTLTGLYDAVTKMSTPIVNIDIITLFETVKGLLFADKLVLVKEKPTEK